MLLRLDIKYTKKQRSVHRKYSMQFHSSGFAAWKHYAWAHFAIISSHTLTEDIMCPANVKLTVYIKRILVAFARLCLVCCHINFLLVGRLLCVLCYFIPTTAVVSWPIALSYIVGKHPATTITLVFSRRRAAAAHSLYVVCCYVTSDSRTRTQVATTKRLYAFIFMASLAIRG